MQMIYYLVIQFCGALFDWYICKLEPITNLIINRAFCISDIRIIDFDYLIEHARTVFPRKSLGFYYLPSILTQLVAFI